MVFFGATANDDTYTTVKGQAVSGNVSTNDIVSCPENPQFDVLNGSVNNGTVTSFDPNTGEFTFVPNPTYTGVGAGFQYRVLCGGEVMDIANVRITVYGGNILADSGVTPMNTDFTGNVKTNDTVFCNQQILYSIKTNSQVNGIITSFNQATGAYTFKPAANYVGLGGFVYEVYCGTGKVGEAMVQIKITGDYNYCQDIEEISEMFCEVRREIDQIVRSYECQ